MQKYYAKFCLGDHEYVIRWKSDSWKYDNASGTFIDQNFYVRTLDELIIWAGGLGYYCGAPVLRWSRRLTHAEFIEERAKGMPRWDPRYEILR